MAAVLRNFVLLRRQVLLVRILHVHHPLLLHLLRHDCRRRGAQHPGDYHYYPHHHHSFK